MSLKPGDYKAVVEKVGFVEHTVTFEVLPKEKRLLDVELEFDNAGEADEAVTDDGLDA